MATTATTSDSPIRIYQVLYDIGVTLPGYLVINSTAIKPERYKELDQEHHILHENKDIVLDFGLSDRGYRFAGLTENYLGIYDLTSQMIVSAVDVFQKGMELDNGETYHPDLRPSVDKSECFAPEGMILPSGMEKMFTPSKIHYYSKSLPQVGRLGTILEAGNYTLNHSDMFGDPKVHKV